MPTTTQASAHTDRVTAARTQHRHAVTAYAAAAFMIPRDAWHEPPALGKWSPAQVTEHLTLGFQALSRELHGGSAMQFRASRWMRLLLRLTVMPRIMAGGRFPRARSPREVRPIAPPEIVREESVAQFQRAASEFDTSVAEAQRAQGTTRLTHPYFGALLLHEALVLSARHIEHHMRQLQPSRAPLVNA